MTQLMKRERTRSPYCGSGRSWLSEAVILPAISETPLAHLSPVATVCSPMRPARPHRLLACDVGRRPRDCCPWVLVNERGLLLRHLRAVLRAALLALLDAEAVEGAADDVVAHAG